MDELETELVDLILEFDEDDVLDHVQKMLDAGREPLKIAEVARAAMEQVGQMFEEKEIFLTELIMSGELLQAVMDKLGFSGEQAGEGEAEHGKFLIGTVQGDIHDIGKNIVTGLLGASGFQVIDIGVDQPPAKFVEAIQKHHPAIVGLSGLLTVAFDAMKATVEALEAAGLRDSVKVIIGGGACDEKVREYVQADAVAESAIQGVEIAKQWAAA